MRRALFVCALLLILPLYGRTADPPFQGLAGPPSPGPAPTETVIRMTVRPAPAPKPALKYQLLPELREMNPGNPIQAYSLCFGEQRNWWYGKQTAEDREKWQKIPLKELPTALKEARERNYGEGKPLRYADEAARLDTPNWQILIPMKREGSKLLLPNLQELRLLASALKVRFRVEIAEQRFDDALVTAKTMLGLSRHLGEHPTLIGYLVGGAVAFVAIGPLDEMIQQPGCPNLFWALTDLPSPFLDLRKARQGERMLPDMDTEFAGLDRREPMTEAQLQKMVGRVCTLLDFNGPGTVPEETIREWLETRTKNKAHVQAARKRLAQALAPADPTKFESFPPLQIVLLDEKLAYQVQHDERMKALALPYWQARAIFAANSPPKKGEMLFANLLSGFDRIKMTQARLDQRLGLLRCVEALRMYASEHSGKLPAKLADIKLPLPVDAVTGKPFVYELKGDTAIVRGTPPPGMEKNAAYNVRYEVTIAK
jgi:hypothetical protein